MEWFGHIEVAIAVDNKLGNVHDSGLGQSEVVGSVVGQLPSDGFGGAEEEEWVGTRFGPDLNGSLGRRPIHLSQPS